VNKISSKRIISFFASFPHALLNKQGQQLLSKLQNQKKLKAKCSILQLSLQLSPPTYTNIAPNEPKSKAPTKEIMNNLIVNSPFTKGCRKANTTKAMARFINPFPSSLATFLSLLIAIIIENPVRLAR